VREVRSTHIRNLALTDAVRRRLLTFVLLFVLVWYTVVVPAPAGAFYVRRAGGEERDADPTPAAAAPVEDLDWPEYING
jgi:hypothetical protein